MERILVASARVRWTTGGVLIVDFADGLTSVTDNSTGTNSVTGEVIYTPDLTSLGSFDAASPPQSYPSAAGPSTPAGVGGPYNSPYLEVEVFPLNEGMLNASGALVWIGARWQMGLLSALSPAVAPGVPVFPSDPITGVAITTNGVLIVDTYGTATDTPAAVVAGRFAYSMNLYARSVGGVGGL